MKIEGYWNEGCAENRLRAELRLPLNPKAKQSPYPDPIPNAEPWPGQAEFVAKMEELEHSNETIQDFYRGFSTCRICKCMNGSSEFENSRIGWRWPIGYLHYINAHNVKPSDEFYAAVMS